jgi:two-component system OmpR family response regulator
MTDHERRSFRILIVEDEPDIRDLLAQSLSEEAEVETAVDGQDALERLAHGPPPSVILLDLRMPRLSGPELLRRLDADGEHPPVVTMSACTSAGPAGASAHLCKPFTLATLLAALRRACAEATAAQLDRRLAALAS